MKFKAEDGTEWETHPAGEFVYDKDQLDLNAKLIRRVPQKSALVKWAFAEYNCGNWANLRADEIAMKGFMKARSVLFTDLALTTAARLLDGWINTPDD